MIELKQLIIHNLDVLEFLDVIGYGIEDLVELMGDELEEYEQELLSACT